jgi:hypothetical protein
MRKTVLAMLAIGGLTLAGSYFFQKDSPNQTVYNPPKERVVTINSPDNLYEPKPLEDLVTTKNHSISNSSNIFYSEDFLYQPQELSEKMDKAQSDLILAMEDFNAYTFGNNIVSRWKEKKTAGDIDGAGLIQSEIEDFGSELREAWIYRKQVCDEVIAGANALSTVVNSEYENQDDVLDFSSEYSPLIETMREQDEQIDTLLKGYSLGPFVLGMELREDESL